MLASNINTKTFDKFSKHFFKKLDPWPISFFRSNVLKENKAVSEAEQIAEKTRVIKINNQRCKTLNHTPNIVKILAPK